MKSKDPYDAELRTERAMKDRFMSHHVESPFIAENIPGFVGLKYFPIDPKYRTRAVLERVATPEEAYLRTNRDGQAVMRYLGDLTFSLHSTALRLRVYHAGEGIGTSVFVPFRDLTSGRESYGPGRYLTFELNQDDVYDIDFNRAFNPYCAYTDAYECGFPPAENDLSVSVRAGEKAWSPDRNPRTPSSAVIEMLNRVAPRRPKAAVAALKRAKRTRSRSPSAREKTRVKSRS
ncbi:MAG: DUF1684 domain-containing protein [Thermoplasmata archaeon]